MKISCTFVLKYINMEQPTTSPNTSTATSEHKVVAKVVSASKEYKV